uniref:NAD(P)(+)--arginine ADP-ribosyltransferase n=1 Tax=Ficedula albicollis TaxID=59894 RepID=A0A803VNE6_FICAL
MAPNAGTLKWSDFTCSWEIENKIFLFSLFLCNLLVLLVFLLNYFKPPPPPGWVLRGFIRGFLARRHRRERDSDIREIALSMVPNSFDDQYQHCRLKMLRALPALNRSEFVLSSPYAEAWGKAAALWNSRAWPRSSRPGSLLRPEQAIALLAYTMEERLYVEFNRAVRRVGRSRREYLNNFHFKVLHFLLTGALRALRGAHSHPRCLHVFRGVDRIRFTARPGQIVRFGQFASSSLLRNVSDFYGTTTTFEVHTCHGADIRRYSIYPEEEEVLIPPYETFNVTGVTQQGDEVLIQLRSHGVHSKYNCAWFRAQFPSFPPHVTPKLLIPADFCHHLYE